MRLYAIVPYAYEYVKLATQQGGIPSLAKKLAERMVLSGNVRVCAAGLKGVMGTDPITLMKAYLTYEEQRAKSSLAKQGNLHSIILTK